MKKLLVIALACVLSMSMFVGCGGGEPAIDKDGNYILEMYCTDQYLGETGKKMTAFVNAFNETAQAKEQKVKLKFRAMANMATALQGSIKGGYSPDLVLLDRFSTPSVVSNNLLLLIDDMITAATDVDVTKLNAEAMEELKFKDQQYGLPVDLDPWGIYINLANVETYNAANPGTAIDVNDLGTWSKVKAAAEKLTIRDGGKVTTAGLNTASMDGQFFSYVFTAGAELINTDKASPNYGDTTLKAKPDEMASRVMETFYFFNDLYAAKVGDSGLGGVDVFKTGKLAMTYGSMYFPQELPAAMRDKVKFLPYPARDLSYMTGGGKEGAPVLVDPETKVDGLTNGINGGMLGGFGLSIPKPMAAKQNAEWKIRRDKSWKVIQTILYDDEITKLYMESLNIIIARNDLLTDDFYKDNLPLSDAAPFIKDYRIRPNVSGYESFESTIVRTELGYMNTKSQSVADTYMHIMTDGNTALRRAQGRN